MAQGLIANLQTFSSVAQEARQEALQKNLDAIGAATGGSIIMKDTTVPGYSNEKAYFPRPSGAGAKRRDLTSTATRSLTADSSVKEKEAKCSGEYENYAMSVSALQQIGDRNGGKTGQIEWARNRGIFFAEEAKEQLVESIYYALYGAIQNTTAMIKDSSSSEISANIFGLALDKAGDQRKRFKNVVYHSTVGTKLKDLAITANRYDENAVLTAGSEPGLFGRVPVEADLNALVNGSPAHYRTWIFGGLVCEAAWEETSPLQLIFDPDKTNSPLYWHGEYEYTIRVNGYTYAAANDNPTDAVLSASSSWTQKVTQAKAVNMILLKAKATLS